MEPEEGRFEFGWLDKNVELAKKYGLKVILCTPSATPPAWLARNHPEILMVRADGTRMNHGSREQADWSSPVYRRYVEKIVAKMAEHYGNNPTVWGWQLDNELSHYGAGMSYSPAAQQRFRDWLREKYGTVDRLNKDWGNSFWSQMYNNFDQIEMPNPLGIGGRRESSRHARPAPLVRERGRGLSSLPGFRAAAQRKEPVDHHQLHDEL